MPIVVTCSNCGAKNRVDVERAGTLQPVCGRCKQPLALPSAGDGKPIVMTDATFDADLRAAGDRPVLVDSWAAWCGPCRMIAPAIDQLAAESDGRYIVGKLDVDANPTIAGKFQIDSIPTMLIFKRGSLVDRVVGLQPKETLSSRLMSHVS